MTISTFASGRPSVSPCFRFHVFVQKVAPITAQNITDKGFLVYVLSEKYAFWVTLIPLLGFVSPHGPQKSRARYITLLGEAKQSYLHVQKLTLVFHHLSSFSPKQLCTLAHLGCTCEADASK